jgi:tetratricopeptide (TPR) repeat protein
MEHRVIQKLALVLLAALVTVFPLHAQDSALVCDEDQPATYYYEIGYDAYRTQEYEVGLHDFSCAVLLDPEYTDARHMRGLMYELLGEYELAAEDYAAVIGIDPEYTISYIGLSNAAIGLGDSALALETLNALLEIEESAQSYSQRGYVYLYLVEDYEAAIEDLTRAVELDATHVRALSDLGRAHYNLGNTQQAITLYLQAEAIDPDYALNYFALANAYYTLDDYEGSIAAMTEYINRVPDDGNAYYNRGLYNSSAGHYEDSLVDYAQAIELYPEDAEAYTGRAVVYNALGEYETALTELEAALSLDADIAWIYSTLAEAYTGVERYADAIDAYRSYIDLGGEDVEEAEAEIAELETVLIGCIVSVETNVNRRIRPGMDFFVLGVVLPGESVPAVGYRTDADGFTWWRLAHNAGWVRGDVIARTGDCAALPER